MSTLPFKLDKEEIRRLAARHGWRDVIERATKLSIPDGRGKESKGQCPNCNDPTADDRFRRHRDFDESGGVACRHCFSDKNSDGFAWIGHVLKIDFHETLKVVAEIVGYEPTASKESNKRNPKPKRQEINSAGPSFKDGEWNEMLFGLWGCDPKTSRGSSPEKASKSVVAFNRSIAQIVVFESRWSMEVKRSVACSFQ